ncbi:MAG: hypothetical protein DRN40_00435 [Thermoplasmata archaeon]|nr:MAG: hypothetical protein DRN28_04015 [Thermoplasmata archaeon]RLF72336.1 MAG: hypothetical protein DRN40_00435 [Thermoplasmata archaeon]
MVRNYSEIRREILETDTQILNLIKKRQELFGELGDVKRRKGIPLLDSGEISERIIHLREEAARLSLDQESIVSIAEILERMAYRAQKSP